jgi:hypothetical protein
VQLWEALHGHLLLELLLLLLPCHMLLHLALQQRPPRQSALCL